MTHQPPNILFLFADQWRWDYLGYAGTDWVHTPNLDRLAARGVRFSHCFTNSPVCAPARIALAAGNQPTRYGANDNGNYLPDSATTFYQRMRDAGYITGLVGKLDLAKPERFLGKTGSRPRAHSWGFTHPVEVEGKMSAGSPTWHGPYTWDLHQRGLIEAFHNDYRKRAAAGWILDQSHDSVLPPDLFADTWIGQRAVRWFDEAGDDFPWFLSVHFVGPHDPYDPPTPHADRYRNASMPGAIDDDLTDKPDWVKGRAQGGTPEQILTARRQYCASITAIDDQVGELLAKVEVRGELDNTIVIFAADHGEMLGDHGLWQKSLCYEAAWRVPLMAAGPGVVADRDSDAMVELIDVNATVCDLAGLPPQGHIDARSFGDILRGQTSSHRDNVITSIADQKAIRTRHHKLITTASSVELFNLRDDPQEMHNAAADQPRLVNQLRNRMKQRFTEGRWQR